MYAVNEHQQLKGDVVVYGATSCGVAAAIQTKRMGKSVILIEPGSRIGGLTTGGLGQTDIGNKEAVGGISREFYEKVRAYYDVSESWRWQKPDEYRDGGQTRTLKDESAMWTFEPSVALNIFHSMLNAHEIGVFYYQRLNRDTGIKKNGSRILSLSMESGESYEGRMFIDATYEGDLMASVGVTLTKPLQL
jgi:flavin-dependent dehydrogenase